MYILKLNTIHYIFCLLLLAFLPVGTTKAQDTLRTDSTRTIIIKSDTVVGFTDTINVSLTDTIKPKHSPTKAALFSAFCPGLGQIYNKKYWKLPIVYAGIGISGYLLIHWQKSYIDYKKGFVLYSNHPNDPATTKYVDSLSMIKKYPNADKKVVLQHFMDIYRNWRDWSVFSVSLIYLLNIVDATVDAYLFYYDISDDISLRLKPVIINSAACYGALGLQLSFDIH